MCGLATIVGVRAFLEENFDSTLKTRAYHAVRDITSAFGSAGITDASVESRARALFQSTAYNGPRHPQYLQIRSRATQQVIAYTDPMAPDTSYSHLIDEYERRGGITDGRPFYASFEGGNPYRILRMSVPGSSCRLYSIASWYANDQTIRAVTTTTVILVTLMSLASALAGWLLIDRSLRSIDGMITFAEQNTDVRMPAELTSSGATGEHEVARLAKTLSSLMERVCRTIEAQRQFSADASHHLSTPVAILGAEVSVALSRERTADEYRSALISVREEADKLKRIVADLSTLATEQAIDSEEIFSGKVDIIALCRSLVDARVKVAGLQRVTVALSVPEPGKQLIVRGSRLQIERAIGNILDNGVKYNRAGGSVMIAAARSREHGDFVEIRITDTGLGIAEENIGRIFERFYRAAPVARDISGSGLGLPIARAVILAHGGRILVSSKPGSGSRFVVLLPLDETDPGAIAAG